MDVCVVQIKNFKLTQFSYFYRELCDGYACSIKVAKLCKLPNCWREIVYGSSGEIKHVQGQDGSLFARGFAEDIGLTGAILSKVGSTAKGGCALAVVDDLGVPIKFLGTGEKVEQLVPFDGDSFVGALFEKG